MQTETSYLGFRLAHPFRAGASPFGYHVDSVNRLEDAGGAAVVLHSRLAPRSNSDSAGSSRNETGAHDTHRDQGPTVLRGVWHRIRPALAVTGGVATPPDGIRPFSPVLTSSR
jgi:hypothetical protein